MGKVLHHMPCGWDTNLSIHFLEYCPPYSDNDEFGTTLRNDADWLYDLVRDELEGGIYVGNGIVIEIRHVYFELLSDMALFTLRAEIRKAKYLTS